MIFTQGGERDFSNLRTLCGNSNASVRNLAADKSGGFMGHNRIPWEMVCVGSNRQGIFGGKLETIKRTYA